MNNKQILWISSLTYSILAIFALIFYKERVIFSDAVCHFFIVLKSGGYFNPIMRYGVYIVQTPLLLAAKLHLSHATLAMIYSLTFVAYQGLIFFLSYWISKDYKIPLIWLLFNTLIVTDTFYWMISELPLGVGIAMLFFAFLQRNNYVVCGDTNNGNNQDTNNDKASPLFVSSQTGSLLLLSFVFLFSMQFFHPLMLVIIAIMASFFFLSTEKWVQRGFLALCFVAFYYAGKLKNSILGISGYDEESMKNFENLTKLYPNYWDLGSNWHFLSYIRTDYYFLPILLLGLTIFYAKNRKWLKLTWMICAFFGYLFIVNVSYYHTQIFEQYYMENLYLPLSLIVILGFIWDFLPSISFQKQSVMLGGIVAIRLIHIFLAHDIFTERLNWERKILTQTENAASKKLLIKTADIPVPTFIVTWASPYEFWLLSAIESKELRSVVIEDNFSQNIASYDSLLNRKNSFFIPFGRDLAYKKLPKTYFDFQDTTTYTLYKPH